MFNMHVYYSAKDKETLEKFYGEVREARVIESTREEEGNIRYDYYFSADRDNEILIVEQWKDKESQQIHDTLPHLVKLMEIKKKYEIITVLEEL